MAEYRFYAEKIKKDTDGKEMIDGEFEPVEWFFIETDEETARTAGKVRLQNEHPDLSLNDFVTDISPR